MTLSPPSTDLARLLTAIRHEPAEDTHRLVYAECLEEHEAQVECGACAMARASGYALNDFFSGGKCPTCSGTGRVSNGCGARAEFVRVQVEIASLKAMWTAHYHYRGTKNCGMCKLKKLRARERELQVAVCPKWRQEQFSPELVAEMNAPLRGGLVASGMINVFYSRGFVSSLTLPAAAFTEATARAVFEREPVERVVLSDVPIWNNAPVVAASRSGWVAGPGGPNGNDADVPNGIWDLFASYEHGWPYSSREIAELALSYWSVTWGRRLAGLPALPLPRELEDVR